MATATEMVDAIDEAIATVIAGGVSSYTIGGVAVTRSDLPKLQSIRRYYAALARPAGGRVRLANLGGA